MNTRFSILLPTYKKRFLAECIDSVLAQTYDNWELIIVNDASPEDIEEVVNRYSDTRIRYYKNAQNIGAKQVVKQWNKCLQYAQGDYCICIGDDDRLLPKCLETYADLIQKYPQVEILHGQTDIINELGKVVAHTPQRPQWESAMSMLYHRTYSGRPQFIGDFCYKTDTLKRRGGFYYLPLAWGSDDISALQAAATHGIANTTEVVFLYRSNDMSITRQKHVLLKWKSILQEANWKRHFLQQPQPNAEDELYRNQLRKSLLLFTLKKMYYVLQNATK